MKLILFLLVEFFLLGIDSIESFAENQIGVKHCPFPLPHPKSDWNLYDVSKLTSGFTLANGSGLAQQQTQLYLCFHKHQNALLLKYQSLDDNIVNPLRGCNAPLYNYDVVEVFLSNGTTDGHSYLELEVSPYSQLFASYISNPNLSCAGISGEPLNCNSSNILWKASVETNGWWAYLSVPLRLMEPITNNTLTGNFFRIDQPKETNQREFSCWISTQSDPACFHKPKYFSILVLP